MRKGALLDYTLEDGRVLRATIELEQWSVWIVDDPRSHVVGFPLEGVLMEVLGLDPAHDDVPASVDRLAALIRRDFPIDRRPVGPSSWT